MKFLIYGSKGWIGQQVVAYLEENGYDYVAGTSRVENTTELEREIDYVSPTHILCLIGRTHGVITTDEETKTYSTIDYLEQKGKIYENVRDNLFSPVSLALLCATKNIHLSYLGTGCIFTYTDDRKTFGEDDLPNFFDSGYSVVKGFTDQLMHTVQKFGKVCNLRIRMPITSQPNSRNFITKITKYEKICSVANSMSVLDNLIPVMIKLAESNYAGTVNLTNPGVISHNEILEMYREIVDPDFTWSNFDYEEQMQILAAGRSNNQLETTTLQEMFPELPNITDAVRLALEKYKLEL